MVFGIVFIFSYQNMMFLKQRDNDYTPERIQPSQVMSRVGPGGASGKEPAYQCKRHKRLEFDPWVGKILWRRKWQPTPVFLPGESQPKGSQASCGVWIEDSGFLSRPCRMLLLVYDFLEVDHLSQVLLVA